MVVQAFPKPGDKFASKYRLVSVLKDSADLIIFHAIEIAFDRDVTLKIIRNEGDERFSEFRRKSQAFSKLRAPFTSTLFSFGRSDSFLYLALEFIEGEDLRFFQSPNPPATIDQTINIFRQSLSSLREAHAHGIVHGDLQIKNIMLVPTDQEDDSQAKIRDFQIVNFSADVESTPTVAADIKELGQILCSILLGRPATPADLDTLKIPLPLKRILRRMTAEVPHYHNVDEILAALGSPTLLDSIAPQRVPTKQIYALGLAFSAFVFIPLGFTSVHLSNDNQEDQVAHVAKQIPLQKLSFTTRNTTEAKRSAIQRAGSTITEALKQPQSISGTAAGSKPVNRLTKKSALKKAAKVQKGSATVVETGLNDEVNLTDSSPEEKVVLGPESVDENQQATPSFQPAKFSARTTVPKPKKKVAKTAAKRPILKAKKKAKAKTKAKKKMVPISF